MPSIVLNVAYCSWQLGLTSISSWYSKSGIIFEGQLFTLCEVHTLP